LPCFQFTDVPITRSTLCFSVSSVVTRFSDFPMPRFPDVPIFLSSSAFLCDLCGKAFSDLFPSFSVPPW
jgi:hypothetical protein